MLTDGAVRTDSGKLRYDDILVENRRKKPTPPSFGTLLWGDPLRIFRRLTPCQELESWAIRWYTFHDPAFAVLGTIPACDRETDRQTDGQTDGQTRRCRKDRASIASRG